MGVGVFLKRNIILLGEKTGKILKASGMSAIVNDLAPILILSLSQDDADATS